MKISLICKLCNFKSKNYLGLNGHIKMHKLSSKEYYDNFYKRKNEDSCKNIKCKKKTNFFGFIKGYAMHCSIQCYNTMANPLKLKILNTTNNPMWNKEAKLKMITTLKSGILAGKNNPMYGVHRYGKDNPMYGKTQSALCKKIVSENSKLQIGAKNPAWQGGIAYLPYGGEFNKALKLKIRKRDNFKCQECNWSEKRLGYTLDIHHIDYNKKHNDENNLISLCKPCHTQTNFSRNDWKQYFKNSQKERGLTC